MAQLHDRIFSRFPQIKDAPPLDIDDLGYVLRVIHDVGLDDKWQQIAQSLTVSSSDLAGFRSRFGGDQSLCLLYSVATWLSGEKKSHVPASWCEVVRAIADPAGGNKSYEAMRIAKNFRDQGGLSQFMPSKDTHAEGTPPTPLRDDLFDGPSIFDGVEDALDDLLVDLSAVASRWIHIGALLSPDITFSWLSEQRSGDDQQNLRATMEAWLNSIGDVTLQRLVEAVEHSAGGKNPVLAKTIKDKYTASPSSPALSASGQPSLLRACPRAPPSPSPPPPATSHSPPPSSSLSLRQSVSAAFRMPVDDTEKRYITAYLLAILSGNDNPCIQDIATILKSTGLNINDDRLSVVFSQMRGRDVKQVIARLAETDESDEDFGFGLFD